MHESCVTCSDLDAFDSNRVTKDFPVTQFTSMEIDGPCNVFIRQGNKESITVKASERNIEKMFIENQGNKLVVDFDGSSINHSRIDVMITIVKVDEMNFKGAGNIETKSMLNLDTLTIYNERTGNLNASFNCKQLNIRASGAGNIDINGVAKYLWIEKTGVGNLNSSGLKADIVKLISSGVGNTDIHAEKVLYLNASGVGNVSYSGNPEIKEYQVHGVGNVEKH
jgi:hypothetical protein